MIIKKVQDKNQGSQLAAELCIELSNLSPNKPVGLATGETMRGVYKQLSELGFEPNFKDAFALDEYLGIEKSNPKSYFFELTQIFSEQLGWRGRLHVPGQDDYSGDDGANQFEKSIQNLGPITVQLLGLGTNGHIAFNEPGSEFDSITRVVDLHEETRIANSRFFESIDDVPKQAMTQGLSTINQADALVLLVFGENKLEALKKALENPDEQTPLAAIKDHQHLTLITDLDV